MNDTGLTNAIETLFTLEYIYDSIEGMTDENDDIFQEIVSLALQVTGGQECLLALLDGREGRGRFKVVGRSSDEQKDVHIPPDLNILFEEVVEGGEAILVGPDTPLTSSAICAPLKIRGTVFGVLSLVGGKGRKRLNQSDLRYIRTLTKRSSLNMENKILYESVYSNTTDTFQSLITSIHLRDHYTKRHSANVSHLAVMTAEALHCSEKEVESLRIAAMLHDVGKIAIPDNILLKNGRLTHEEYTVIKGHPLIGEDILKPVMLMDTERKIIRHHHERWDGKGYPDGLAGEEIPFLSRILSVADSFDAMISNRPYREALDIDVAMGELYRNRSSQFDKEIVGVFIPTCRALCC